MSTSAARRSRTSAWAIATPAAHLFCRLQREATGEDGEACEDGLLLRIEEIEAPIDQRAQRLLAREVGAGSARQEPEAIGEPLGDRLDGERAHARGREFESERDAVEPPTDFDECRRVLEGQGESRLHRLDAVDEQAHCFIPEQRIDGRRFARLGNGQGRHRIRSLAGHVQGLAARREELESRAGLHELLREVGARVDQVLAVVENHEELAVPDELDERLDHRAAGLLHDSEYRGHRLRHQARIGHRRKFDEPDAVGKLVEHVCGNLQRQPRLADAADAEQREDRDPGEELFHLGLPALAADERGRLPWQVVGRRFERAQRRKVLPQLRMKHLINVLGAREIAQSHASEVAERHTVRQPLADRFDDGSR